MNIYEQYPDLRPENIVAAYKATKMMPIQSDFVARRYEKGKHIRCACGASVLALVKDAAFDNIMDCPRDVVSDALDLSVDYLLAFTVGFDGGPWGDVVDTLEVDDLPITESTKALYEAGIKAWEAVQAEFFPWTNQD